MENLTVRQSVVRQRVKLAVNRLVWDVICTDETGRYLTVDELTDKLMRDLLDL
jgi:hypothetical protein